MQIRRDQRITNEFLGLFEQLEKKDPEDDRYNKQFIFARVLRIQWKKMQKLRRIENGFRFKKLWDESYSNGDQKVKYLKTGVRNTDYIKFGDGECVAAIKSLANLNKPTSSWKKGFRAVYSIMLPGTVIATFNKNGRYSGHAAVYKGRSEGKIEVYDQNWWYQDKSGNVKYDTLKSFGTHYITDNDGMNNPNNKLNYYIVKIK